MVDSPYRSSPGMEKGNFAFFSLLATTPAAPARCPRWGRRGSGFDCGISGVGAAAPAGRGYRRAGEAAGAEVVLIDPQYAPRVLPKPHVDGMVSPIARRRRARTWASSTASS